MSDVLIKGMEMPKSCFYCPMREWHIIRGEKIISCRAAGTLITNEDERPAFCPLIEVPKHGRLIDADALLNFLNHCMFPSDMVTTMAVRMATNWIKEAPTIIEAEERK